MWSGWRRADAARRKVRRALPSLKGVRLPAVADLHLPDLHAPEIDWARGRMGSRAATLWPALFAAAGAGAAVWWWNQWARGNAEAEASRGSDASKPQVELSAEDRAGAAEGAAAPEAIMAHAPAPEQPAMKPAGHDGAQSPQADDGLDASLVVLGATSRKPGKAAATG